MTRDDIAARKRALRKGRERGCTVYITAEVLEQAGIDPRDPPPHYQLWPGRKRTVLVQLYEEA